MCIRDRRPAEQRGRAGELHGRFADPLGDLMTLLNLWNYLQKQQKELSSSAFRRLCKAEFLNFLRVREWMDLYRQISRTAKSAKGERKAACLLYTSRQIAATTTRL